MNQTSGCVQKLRIHTTHTNFNRHPRLHIHVKIPSLYITCVLATFDRLIAITGNSSSSFILIISLIKPGHILCLHVIIQFVKVGISNVLPCS